MQKLLTFFVLCFPLTTFSDVMVADLVVTNGLVRTMDAKRSVVQSIAVLNGKIVAVGMNTATKPMIGPKTKVLDAKGKLVLPGFNDAHVHFLEMGADLTSIDLRSAQSPVEFVQRIKAYAAKVPKGRWILGGRWNHENWTPSNLPTAALIDAVTPDHPVFIERLDGHMALANSLAMKLAHITRETKDLEGGVIVRDTSGQPTGVLKDAAMDYVTKVVPESTWEQKVELAEAATNHAASLGVTSVQDMSAGTNVDVYRELMRRGKLKTRIYGCSPLSDYKRLEKAGVHYASGDAMLRVGCLKGFADGSLGSTTAWLFEPYLDAPKSTGLSGEEVPRFADEIAAAEKDRLQVFIHAIGDRANASVLDLYEKNAQTNGVRDRRFRIEHAQHLREHDIRRFGKLGVVASMQPAHLMDDGRWASKRLNEKRLKSSYAWRSLLDSGAVLAFGSDSPVVSLNPLLGIYAAVTRRTLDNKNPNGWYPEQKTTLDEAVRAFTWGSAYAEFQDDVKGTLEVGKLADFVVLTKDIFSINPIEIQNVKVLTTVVDGKVVYSNR
jgi:predicted amidohydrolase YtcJ